MFYFKTLRLVNRQSQREFMSKERENHSIYGILLVFNRGCGLYSVLQYQYLFSLIDDHLRVKNVIPNKKLKIGHYLLSCSIRILIFWKSLYGCGMLMQQFKLFQVPIIWNYVKLIGCAWWCGMISDELGIKLLHDIYTAPKCWCLVMRK